MSDAKVSLLSLLGQSVLKMSVASKRQAVGPLRDIEMLQRPWEGDSGKLGPLSIARFARHLLTRRRVVIVSKATLGV